MSRTPGGSRGVPLEYLEDWRSDQRRLSEYRQSLLQELRAAYDSIKRARRELRVDGFTTRFRNDPGAFNDNRRKIYREQVETLDDAQLALEDFKLNLGSLPDGTLKRHLIDRVTKMETYVGKLVSEWEEQFPQISTGPNPTPLTVLARLMEFTGAARSPEVAPDGFKACVSKPYHKIAGALQTDILQPTPA